MSRSAAAIAEQSLSARIRQRWRLQAVDDDLRAALGRRVLVAGKDLRNFGMELKSVEAGPLNLNDRQYDVLRRTREDTPPFVFQFTAPPAHPWCFRVHALRDDALTALGRRPHVTLTELQAEAFTATLVMGLNFTTTRVEPVRFTPTERPNRHLDPCLVCGQPVAPGRGRLLRPVAQSSRWAVEHTGCRTTNVSSVEIVFDEGEPAFYLAAFSTESVPEEAWPPVTPPSDYSSPAGPILAEPTSGWGDPDDPRAADVLHGGQAHVDQQTVEVVTVPDSVRSVIAQSPMTDAGSTGTTYLHPD